MVLASYPDEPMFRDPAGYIYISSQSSGTNPNPSQGLSRIGAYPSVEILLIEALRAPKSPQLTLGEMLEGGGGTAAGLILLKDFLTHRYVSKVASFASCT